MICKKKNRLKSAVLAAIMILAAAFCCAPTASAQAVYPEVTVNGVTMPLAEYLPGTYFTKNGKACTCHNVSSINCVSSPSRCNCLRYVTVDGVDYDLRGVQCIGFARYVFLRLFGFPDTVDYSSKYSSVGSLDYGEVNSASVKTLVNKAKPGAHIRFNLRSSQHSVVLLKAEDDGFYVYHANSGGDGYTYEQCIVTTKYYTYADFASYAYRGIVYVNMPNEYPDEKDSEPDGYENAGQLLPVETVGVYVTDYNLNFRADATTDSESLAVIPADTALLVLSRKDGFGNAYYNGVMGYVSLDYVTRICAATQNFIPHTETETLILSCANPFFRFCELTTDKLKITDGTDDLGDSVIKTATDMKYTVTYGDQTVAEFTVALLGDVNPNSVIDLTDYLTMKAYLKGIDRLSEAQKIAADCDYSGSVDTCDYFTVKRILCG